MLYNGTRTEAPMDMRTETRGSMRSDTRIEAQAATDAGAVIAQTIASSTRSTPWTLVDVVPLKFDAHHPQGMVRIGSTWWISTVDIAARKGYVMAVDGDGALLQQVPIGDEQCYHPGGMDFDGSAMWVPSAEYRPDSTTHVYRMKPGSTPEKIFAVDDHVGAIARCGVGGDLVGWSWGSRRFYRWSVEGRLLAAQTNPAFFVDHQDCQWLGGGRMLCGGVAEVQLANGPGWLGGLGLLNVDDLVIEREVPFPYYSPLSGRAATQNPLWSEVVGDQLMLHLLPDDGAGVIQSFSTPLIGRPRKV